MTSESKHHVQKQVILQAQNVTMRFGGLVAVDNVDMTVHAGEIDPGGQLTHPDSVRCVSG